MVDVIDMDVDLKIGVILMIDLIFIQLDQGCFNFGKVIYDKEKGIVVFSDGVKVILNLVVKDDI